MADLSRLFGLTQNVTTLDYDVVMYAAVHGNYLTSDLYTRILAISRNQIVARIFTRK